jgi:hypothetical protein
MAMNVTLRTKNGGEVMTKDLGGLPAFPEIINRGGKLYVLRRVTPDKENAFYHEANVLDMEEGE